MSLTTVLILLGIGLTAGLLSGFVGIGGGVIIVPALVYFLSLNQHMAQGTSLLLMLPPIGILAVYNYYKAGEFRLDFAIIIAVAFVVGGYFGSKISLNIPPELVKRIFGGFLLLVAIKMIFWK